MNVDVLASSKDTEAEVSKQNSPEHVSGEAERQATSLQKVRTTQEVASREIVQEEPLVNDEIFKCLEAKKRTLYAHPDNT